MPNAPSLVCRTMRMNRAAKAGIANRRGGDQYLPHKRRIFRIEFKPWRYGTEEWCCYKQSPRAKNIRLSKAKGVSR